MPSPDPETNPQQECHVGSTTSIWQSTQNYWYGFEPPHTLAIFRILLGSYFLIGWLSVLPWVTFFYSSEGIPFPLLTPPDGDLKTLLDRVAVLIQPPPVWLAWILYAFMIFLSALIILGCCTRTALTIYAIMFVYYWLLHLHTINSSYDRLAFITVVIMALSDCDAVLSLEASGRKRRGLPPIDAVPIWPARLLAVQVAFVYVGTGIYKITSPAWNDGAIVQYSLQGDWGSSIAFWLLQYNLNPTFFSGAVLMTILLEVWGPFLLFHPRLKILFFIIGTLFHLGIALMLNIWGFLVMPLTYILFVDPSTGQRTWERCMVFARRLAGLFTPQEAAEARET